MGYRNKITILLLCTALFLSAGTPAVHAATGSTAAPTVGTNAGAGFAAQSVFFSHTPLTDGTSVLIYASIVNTSADAFSGKVVFTDAGDEIGSLAVSFAPGEARMVSISWTPTSGPHTISATLKSANDVPVASTGQLTASAAVTTTVAPKPTNQPVPDTNAVQPSTDIQKAVEYVSPPVASTLQPAFVTIDKARTGAAAVIDDQIKQTKATLAKQKTSTAGTAKAASGTGGSGAAPATQTQSSLGDTAWSWMLNAYVFILSALRFGVANPIAFYPVIILAFFFGMFKLYKHMTRPRFDRF